MNLIECFSKYTVKCTEEEIPSKILEYMACIMFNTNAPISRQSFDALENYSLLNNCYNHGAIRLWVYNLHIKDDTIPEKASTFYRMQPFRMKSECIQFLKEHTNDIYTLSHLFGDCYNVDVYINNQHIQEAAGSRLELKPHKYKLYMKKKDERFSIIQQPNTKMKKRRQRSGSFVLTSKFALRQCGEGTNVEIGSFVPGALKHTYSTIKLQNGTYTIYPPDRTKRITLDIIDNHKLYLFDDKSTLIDIYTPGQRENMYFELKEGTTQLILIEAQSEKQARNKV